MATLKLTGPARDLHAVLGLLGLADATFDWDRGKEVSPGRWRWKGTGPDKGQYRTQGIKPGTRARAKPKAKAPPPGHRDPSRTTVEEFLDELRLTPPGEWTPKRVQEVADWLCDDLRRDEIRELGRRMGYRVGAQLKNQLARDLVEQAREGATQNSSESVDPNAALAPPVQPTYTPTVGRHDELGIAPSDLDSIRRWAVADGHPMSPADVADVAQRAGVLAHQGMDALRPGHIRQGYAEWLTSQPPVPPPGFTGTLTDSLGRTYTYVDGVRVESGSDQLTSSDQSATIPPESTTTPEVLMQSKASADTLKRLEEPGGKKNSTWVLMARSLGSAWNAEELFRDLEDAGLIDHLLPLLEQHNGGSAEEWMAFLDRAEEAGADPALLTASRAALDYFHPPGGWKSHTDPATGLTFTAWLDGRVRVTGNTFTHKGALKKAGLVFDAGDKSWIGFQKDLAAGYPGGAQIVGALNGA